MFKNKSFIFAGLVFLIAVSALAHKGEHHGDQKKEEPKVHLDMTKDVPFAGHGTPMEDLEAIQSSLEKARCHLLDTVQCTGLHELELTILVRYRHGLKTV